MYYYVVEQLFFVIFFARALAQFTTNNLVFHKLCSGDDGNHYLGKICPNDEEAQKETTILNTWLFVTGNLSFIIACTIGGYYSDLYKRRKPLLWVPLVGLLICGVANIAFVHFWDEVSGKVVAVVNGVMCLFGETNLLYTGGLCYVTDHSPEQSRTFRIGILLAAYYISTPIGRGLGGQLNVLIGFINCYLISMALYAISLVVVFLCLSELRQEDTAYYSDDKEKTSSIQRALKFYDKVSISSDTKEKVTAHPNRGHQESGGDKKVKEGEQLGVEDVNKIDVTHKDSKIKNNKDKNVHHFRTASTLEKAETTPESEHTKDTSDRILKDNTSAVTENTVTFAIEASNIRSVSPNVPSDRVFEESKWKQTPVSKKAKSKKARHFYDAYVEGKRPPLPNEPQEGQKGRSLFLAFYSLYESWKTLFRKRTGHKTAILATMVLTSPLYVAPMIVENSVFPLFVRQKFHWTEKLYGAFAAFKLSVIVVGIMFSIGVMGKVLKVPDPVIGAMASVVDTLACFGYIMVTESWQMFVVPICDMFHGSAQIAVTAVISKQVDESERGKIFALKYTMDSLIPIILYPIYNGVYRATLTEFPEAFFLISAACAAPGIFAFSFVQYLQRDRTYMITTRL